MKKIIYICLLICISANLKAQIPPPYMDTVDRLAPITVKGVVKWGPATYIEKDTVIKGVTTPNFTILADTSKTGGLYEIGGAIDFISNPKNVYMFFNYAYVNENKVTYIKQLLNNGVGASTYTGESDFSPKLIWIPPGSIIKIYITQYGTTIGSIVYNCRAYIRFLGK